MWRISFLFGILITLVSCNRQEDRYHILLLSDQRAIHGVRINDSVFSEDTVVAFVKEIREVDSLYVIDIEFWIELNIPVDSRFVAERRSILSDDLSLQMVVGKNKTYSSNMDTFHLTRNEIRAESLETDIVIEEIQQILEDPDYEAIIKGYEDEIDSLVQDLRD